MTIKHAWSLGVETEVVIHVNVNEVVVNVYSISDAKPSSVFACFISLIPELCHFSCSDCLWFKMLYVVSGVV